MIKKEHIEQFKVLLSNAESIIIAYGEKATIDEQAAAVGLAEGMTLLGKHIRLASPSIKQSNVISGLEHTVTELGHQNLVVSFDYSQESVANVSYHISEDNQKFFLTVKPKKGFSPLDSSTVQFEYTGTEADMILVVGVENHEELKQLYFGYEDVYRDATVIPFTTYPPYQSRFSFASMGRSSLSEVVSDLLTQLEVPLTEHLSTNLLKGIEWSTDQLQSETTTADTFEVIAQLMRAGAQRSPQVPQPQPVSKTNHSNSTALPTTAKGSTDSLRDALKKAAQKQSLQPPTPSEKNQPLQSSAESTKPKPDIKTPEQSPTEKLQQSKNHHASPKKHKKRRRRKKQKNKQNSPQPGGLHFQPSGHSVSGA